MLLIYKYIDYLDMLFGNVKSAENDKVKNFLELLNRLICAVSVELTFLINKKGKSFWSNARSLFDQVNSGLSSLPSEPKIDMPELPQPNAEEIYIFLPKIFKIFFKLYPLHITASLPPDMVMKLKTLIGNLKNESGDTEQLKKIMQEFYINYNLNKNLVRLPSISLIEFLIDQKIEAALALEDGVEEETIPLPMPTIGTGTNSRTPLLDDGTQQSGPGAQSLPDPISEHVSLGPWFLPPFEHQFPELLGGDDGLPGDLGLSNTHVQENPFFAPSNKDAAVDFMSLLDFQPLTTWESDLTIVSPSVPSSTLSVTPVSKGQNVDVNGRLLTNVTNPVDARTVSKRAQAAATINRALQTNSIPGLPVGFQLSADLDLFNTPVQCAQDFESYMGQSSGFCASIGTASSIRDDFTPMFSQERLLGAPLPSLDFYLVGSSQPDLAQPCLKEVPQVERQMYGQFFAQAPAPAPIDKGSHVEKRGQDREEMFLLPTPKKQ